MYHSEGFDNGGGYAQLGAGGWWEISVPSQICSEFKTVLKNKV